MVLMFIPYTVAALFEATEMAAFKQNLAYLIYQRVTKHVFWLYMLLNRHIFSPFNIYSFIQIHL